MITTTTTSGVRRRYNFWIVLLCTIIFVFFSNLYGYSEYLGRSFDFTGSSTTVNFKQQQQPQQPSSSLSSLDALLPPSLTGVLFVIFCGGEHGKAHMDAILDTWGSKVERALILSNTPQDLPLDRIHNINNHHQNIIVVTSNNNETTLSYKKYWKIIYTSSLDGGKNRKSKKFWNETISIIHRELQLNPTIRWIVRSDSDTWWNVHRLYDRLHYFNKHNDNGLLLPFNNPTMMGQFFPLKDFQWISNISSWGGYLTHINKTSDGRNAFLTGGSGIIFTNTSIQQYYQCLIDASSNNNNNNNDTRNTRQNIIRHDIEQEDIWLSRLAYFCNVTLLKSDEMFQYKFNVKKSYAKSILSVHKVAPIGKSEYIHPSYYEDAIRNISYSIYDIIN